MAISSAVLKKVILDSFFEGDNDDGNGGPKICSLHDISDTKNSHNCLACNFAELIDRLIHIASVYDHFEDKTTGDLTYIIWLYLLTERMQEIFKLISMPEEIKSQEFPAFKRIRCWGNFIKHPKAFFLTHHATFGEYLNGNATKIDDDFVTRYYSGDKHNQELYKYITNAARVNVVLPDLLDLTKKLGSELSALQHIIESNPIYQQILKDKTIFENYFGDGELTS